MNIIYYGISIIALLTATETYAMEDARGDFQEYPITQRSSYRSSQGFVDLNVQNLQRIMNNKIYNPPLKQLPSEEEILNLCVQASNGQNTPDQQENIYFNYAGALLRLGCPTHALIAFENGLNVKTPKNQPKIQELEREELYSHIEKVLDQQKQPDKDIEAYKAFLLFETTKDRVTWADLGRERILCQLANVLNGEERYEEAAKAYQEALQLKTRDGKNVLIKGRRDIMLKFNFVSHRVNLGTLAKLISKEPGNIDSVAQAAMDLSHPTNEEQVKALKKAKKLKQYDTVLGLYMQVLRQESRDGTYALADYQTATIYDEIGIVLAMQGKYENARIAYELALNEKDYMGENALQSTKRDNARNRLKTVEKMLKSREL